MKGKKWVLVFWGMMIMFNIFALNSLADGIKPEMIPNSNRYQVEIRKKGQQKWKALFVYQGINPNQKAQDVSWASFELANTMEVRIEPLNVKFDSVKVRPGALSVKHATIDKYIILIIDRPLQISIEINGNQRIGCGS